VGFDVGLHALRSGASAAFRRKTTRSTATRTLREAPLSASTSNEACVLAPPIATLLACQAESPPPEVSRDIDDPPLDASLVEEESGDGALAPPMRVRPSLASARRPSLARPIPQPAAA